MTKKIKTTIASLFAAAFAFCGLGVATLSANADDIALTKENVRMLSGASIRKIADENGNYGIRFTGLIEKTAKEATEEKYGAANVEYGILVCPKDFLTVGVTLDFDESDNLVRYTDGAEIKDGVKFFQSRKANSVALSESG